MGCKLPNRGSDSKFKALAQGKQQFFNSERDLLPGLGERMVKFRRIFLTVSSVFQELTAPHCLRKLLRGTVLAYQGLEAAMSGILRGYFTSVANQRSQRYLCS